MAWTKKLNTKLSLMKLPALPSFTKFLPANLRKRKTLLLLALVGLPPKLPNKLFSKKFVKLKKTPLLKNIKTKSAL